MLQPTIDATLRNLSTLALVCALVLAPLHFVYAFVNRDAIGVREMAPAIEEFPEGRQVRSVGRAELERERLSRWLVIGLELLLGIPLLLRPTRRVLQADADGRVPSALGAFTGETRPASSPATPLVVAGAVIALAVIALVEVGASILVPMLEDTTEWAGVAAAQTAARSIGLPFLLVALAGSRAAARERSLDLY
jgi:hypothetical protein